MFSSVGRIEHRSHPSAVGVSTALILCSMCVCMCTSVSVFVGREDSPGDGMQCGNSNVFVLEQGVLGLAISTRTWGWLRTKDHPVAFCHNDSDLLCA